LIYFSKHFPDYFHPSAKKIGLPVRISRKLLKNISFGFCAGGAFSFILSFFHSFILSFFHSFIFPLSHFHFASVVPLP